MRTKRIKWLIYTVLVGLMPVFSRIFAWLIIKGETVDILSAADFVAFGLVLHISNINEIEHIANVTPEWKTVQNGISIIFIALYSVLFSVSIAGVASVDVDALLLCSIGLSVVSLMLSYSVYHYLVHNEQETGV